MDIKSPDIDDIVASLINFREPLTDGVVDICKKILMLDEVFNYDTLGDVVVVAGYPRCLIDRAPLAKEIMQKNVAQYVILSGGANIPNTSIKESKVMFDYLVSAGVSEARIIVEDVSKTTLENASFSLMIVKNKLKFKKPRVIALTSSFHIRRFFLALTQASGDNKNCIIPMPSESLDCPADCWHELILGRAIVAREIQILKKHVIDGRLPSFKL